MSDIAEGIGGAIEGALLGGAVEPAGGSAESDRGVSGGCRNCGADPLGNYCQECGQKVHVHRTLSAIGHDLLHGVLHLDGKFWATLPLLLFKPGQLTRRYIEGERARFVSPMAMFLFSVFAMFAVFQMVGLTTPTDLDFDAPAEQIRTNGEAQAERMRDEIETLDEGDPKRAELERELAVVEKFLANAPLDAGAGQDSNAEQATEGLDLRDADSNVNLTGIEVIDEGLLKKWRQNPGLMLYKLQANGYKFSWLLIPLSIPFVWLVFAWKRRFKAYDHAIFVTYSLSFMSLLFIASSLLALIPNVGPIVALLLVFIPPVHVYKQLRGAYELGRLSAFWRLLVLSAFIWVVLLLFLQALLLLGAF